MLITRLGRTSFRAVRRCRDYMAGKSKASWLYMSRLAAIKEFAFMRGSEMLLRLSNALSPFLNLPNSGRKLSVALHAHGFPTPNPIDQNRHIVAMSRIKGFPMAQVKTGNMVAADEYFSIAVALLRRLGEHGLVHCDYNEFNLMITEDGRVVIIDFPQMVALSHPNAKELYERDVNGLVKFFAMKMRYVAPSELIPVFEDVLAAAEAAGAGAKVAEEVRAAGFSAEEDADLLGYFSERAAAIADGTGDYEEYDDDEDDEGEDGDDDDEDIDALATSLAALTAENLAAATAAAAAAAPAVTAEHASVKETEGGHRKTGRTAKGSGFGQLRSRGPKDDAEEENGVESEEVGGVGPEQDGDTLLPPLTLRLAAKMTGVKAAGSSVGGGAASGVAALAGLEGQGEEGEGEGEEGPVEPEREGVSVSELEGSEDASAGFILSAEAIQRAQIKARREAKAGLSRWKGGGANSRNATKRRNKYGKIDKSEKIPSEW